MQAPVNSADCGASVFTERVEYPAMTQAILEHAIQRRDEMLDDESAIQRTAKSPDDEGYSSSSSSGHRKLEAGDSSSREQSPNCTIADDATDAMTDVLFERLSKLDQLSFSFESDGHSSSELEAMALFNDMNSKTQECSILDQTVPEEQLQDFLPSLGSFTCTDIETILLSSQSMDTFVDMNEKELCVTDTTLPEFDVLLNQENGHVFKHVTKQDNECPQQTNTAEHYVEDVDEEEEEEEYEDYDPKDEDYVPPDARKHQSSQHSRRKSQHKHRQIYSQLGSNKRSRRHSPQLWVFLLNCLCDMKLNPSIIAWEDRKRGIFKLRNSKMVAELWGRRLAKEQKKPMNYEKFSRAIRYYYHKKVIISHPKRLTYQFGPSAKGWQEKLRGAAK